MGITSSTNVNTLNPIHVVAAVEGSEAAALQEFIQVLRNVEIAKYTLVATFTLFVYDLLLTFDEEVFLVWRSRFGVPKAFFFLNRYFPFIDLVLLVYILMAGSNPSSCVTLFRVLGVFVEFGFVIAQFILAMRTWAIWAQRKSVTILLVGMLTSCLTVGLYVLYRYLKDVSYAPLGPFEPAFKGCPLHFENRLVLVDFAMVMTLESIALALLLVKALEHFKHSRSTLMVRMFKDGVIYFFFILITSIANLVVIITAPLELHNFLIITQRILHSVFCSRVLLHIRGAYTNSSFTSTTSSDSQYGPSGPHYAFRRPVIPDAEGLRGHRFRAGGGRPRRRDSFELELTSVDVDTQIQQRDTIASRSEDLYEAPALTGWGIGSGYDGTPSLEVDGPESGIGRGDRGGGDLEVDQPRGKPKDLPEAY